MSVLENLEPRRVFHFFEELCATPHGSGNTQAVSDWCAAFARARGLEYHQDALHNLIIVKEATPGYEHAAPVILQGHMDMVCEKAAGCSKDMAREGLSLRVDGDTVYAEGTTLGGDDGIAVAMALAILDADDLPHPRIEAVFTVDEEVGLLGAAGLDAGCLQGRRMLNLDSEEEGVFTVGCAGGAETICVLPLRREPFDGVPLRVTVSGLAGGHSGNEIDKGRGNSSMLLGRVLWQIRQAADTRILSLGGGFKDNAIPRESWAELTTADAPAAQAVCQRLNAAFRNEFRRTDPEVRVDVSVGQAEGVPMDQLSTARTVCLLTCAPNGIQAMSADVPGLVQTSLNLGILSASDAELRASFCVRSNVASQKTMLMERLRCLAETLGGHTEVVGDYPGWEYRPDSPLRDLMEQVFREQYGRAPKVEIIHAGVECGLFSAKLPGLDCVSIGPDLTEIHTCRERMHIASVQRTWALVTELLRRMK